MPPIEWSLPPLPSRLSLTSVVLLLTRSRRNRLTANDPMVFDVRSLAELANITKRPSGLTWGVTEFALPPAGNGTFELRAEINCAEFASIDAAPRTKPATIPSAPTNGFEE